MQALQALAARVYYGNSVQDWAEALGIFLIVLTVLPVVRLAIARRLRTLPAHESPTALELVLALLEHTTRLFMLAVAAYLALKTLKLPPRTDHLIDMLIEVAVWTQIALWGMRASSFVIDRRMHRSGGVQLPTYAILRFVSFLLVWAMAVLMLLANLGVNITALVTSLGIGGVAFALAIQNVLGDILASLAIAWDKPFQIGDELRFNDIIGNVEQIGIKSTRLRSIDGEQIVIGNSQLLQAQIHNFGRALQQRTTMVLTLAFDTPIETLRSFPGLIEGVVAKLPGTRLDHCYLRGLGASGFEFELSFFATELKKMPLAAVRQQVVLRLLDELPAGGLAFSSAASPVLAEKGKAPATPAPSGTA